MRGYKRVRVQWSKSRPPCIRNSQGILVSEVNVNSPFHSSTRLGSSVCGGGGGGYGGEEGDLGGGGGLRGRGGSVTWI